MLELLGADPSQAFANADIAEFCGTSAGSLQATLVRLVSAGQIRRAGHGKYQLTRRGKR